MPKKLKSLTTTRSRSMGAGTRGGRRLPSHREPIHPGEMLLGEFLRPSGISQSAFAIRLGISFRVSTRSSAIATESHLTLHSGSSEFWECRLIYGWGSSPFGHLARNA